MAGKCDSARVIAPAGIPPFSHYPKLYTARRGGVRHGTRVRSAPDDDADRNRRQCERLQQLSDYCRRTARRLIFALLVPPTRAPKCSARARDVRRTSNNRTEHRMSDQIELDTPCIITLRSLSIDAVEQARSGHPGTPMGIAPTVYCLWQRLLRYAPHDPHWPNRDRFVLSAGHASALLYSLLYLSDVRAGGDEEASTDPAAVTLDDQ